MSTVSTSLSLAFATRARVVASGETLKHNVKQRVSGSKAVQYGVRKAVSPAKVLTVSHNVKKRISKSNIAIRYGVRVPISDNGGAFSTAFSSAFDSAPGGGEGQKIVGIVCHVRSRVSQSFSIEYDTGIVGPSSVSKSFSVSYHTLVTPGDNAAGVITTPLKPDSIPPQIVTTSF